MNVILAIETCVPRAGVVLWRAGEVVCERQFTSDRNHNSMVFDALEEVLAELGGGPLDLVLVGTGPGSYSGTRIGIAAGQGVALAHGCPAVGLGSFAATPVARAGAACMAVGDARRGVYFASRIGENGEAQAVELMDHAALVELLEGEPGTALFSFDEPASLNLGEGVERRVEQVWPEAGWLVDVWQGLDADRQAELVAAPLSPTYLRAPFTSRAKPGHPLLR